ncbi:MAG: asparagine synthase-related protein, partial [Symbiobacteriaceae bacterium]|nr:asparagine synthase-related protein [Symbiobacteriaceae bacterium]
MNQEQLQLYLQEQITAIQEKVGKQKVLLALSGGVDSSVCAAILAQAIPGQTVAIFVDH